MDGVDVHTEDLELARKATAGETEALRRFREVAIAPLSAVLNVVPPGRRDTFVDDTVADLVSPRSDAPPPLSTYSGRASLGSWLSAVARRRAHRLTRDDGRRDARETSTRSLFSATCSPLRGWLNADETKVFKGAFTQALGELDVDERLLLKQSILDGLSSQQLAPLYGCHRATVSRRIHHARERLRDLTIEHLAQRLNTDSAQARLRIGELLSHIELTLSRVFEDEPRDSEAL